MPLDRELIIYQYLYYMKKLAIIGCGKLGGIVADAINKGLLPQYELIGAYSRTKSKTERFIDEFNKHGHKCRLCEDVQDLISMKPDYIVEAASPAAMLEMAIPALECGISIVTLSIGSLADDSFYNKVIQTAQQNRAHVYIVSGATGGFDILQTATLMGNVTAKFFNEKGPNALVGTSVYTDALQQEQKVVFQGTASDAIKLFPTKVNVTVAASRASVGPREMQVIMQSSPGFIGDTQRVEIKNEQVHAVIDVYSATAEIAGWSVVNTLRNIVSPIIFC